MLRAEEHIRGDRAREGGEVVVEAAQVLEGEVGSGVHQAPLSRAVIVPTSNRSGLTSMGGM